MLNRALVAEFVGTFALVFVGAAAGALGIGLLGIALAHGLVVLAIISAYGRVSGAHINPAVTIALWSARQIDATRTVAYIAAQLTGGLTAGLALAFVLGGAESGLGTTLLADSVDPVRGLLLEALLTFFLVNSFMNTALGEHATQRTGIAVGGTLVFCMLAGAPLTGASLNPARTLGPAVATGRFDDLWLYFVGPILGGLAAAFLFTGLLRDDADTR
ncbi:MAG: aquaporin [Acidobacteriota bacterium]